MMYTFDNVTTLTSIIPDVSSTTAPTADFPKYAGYICCAISVLFFGSNFVPVKKFETGDGMFFQWILCSTIWMCGLIVNAVQGFPTFYPLTMIGGLLWATGNICVVPIIKTIGLGLGILIWGTTNMLSGWASGRFGWFGLTPEYPTNYALNYAGVACAVFSALVLVTIKPDVTGSSELVRSNSQDELLGPTGVNSLTDSRTLIVGINEGNYIDRLTPLKKRIIGIVLSVFSGSLYGLSFTPCIYIQNNYKGASQDGLDYVFGFFCGIYATSFLYFTIYCMISKNKPNIYGQAILPGIVSGVMWAVGDICWFVANSTLTEAISFPIITTVPGIIAAIWGIAFKEIRGLRNFLILAFAFAVTIAGAILTAFSKS
ncbi:transmembrane protein 144-like isoform X2 [Tubulanus polymorphus]|uniref:transmembrane protein 144-like isoform X2 n=1 Tax=Tubulanus polymorphus TaxID=672921 RepID=UPI003DA668C7